MTTAPTPSEAERLARFQKSMQTHLGASRGSCRHPEERQSWDDYDRTAAELRRLQAEKERLLAQIHKLEMDALDLASENSILKRAETDELEARKPLPLSDEQIERLREQTFSTNNPFCPCDSKTMRKAVRAAERAHGITGGSS